MELKDKKEIKHDVVVDGYKITSAIIQGIILPW